MVEASLDGPVHQAPADLRAAIEIDPPLLAPWQSLIPLGRNAFICWVEGAEQAATRERRIQRTGEKLHESNRRPCCWAGCVHRTGKPPSAWQQAVLIAAKKR